MNEDNEASAMLILTSCAKEGADLTAFNRWYTEMHVPDVLTVEEFVSCRRYKVARARLFPGVMAQPEYEYVAVYKIKARTEEDLDRVLQSMIELSGQGIVIDPAFDFGRSTAAFLLPITGEIVKDPAYKHSGASATTV